MRFLCLHVCFYRGIYANIPVCFYVYCTIHVHVFAECVPTCRGQQTDLVMYTLTGHHCHDSRRSAGVRPFPFNYTIAYPDKACHLMWVMATFGLAIMTSCGLRDEGSTGCTDACVVCHITECPAYLSHMWAPTHRNGYTTAAHPLSGSGVGTFAQGIPRGASAWARFG